MNKYLKFLVGLMMSGAGLAYAFSDFDLTELKTYFLKVEFEYILLSMVVMVLSVAMRAVRWRLMLTPMIITSFHPLFSATMIGYFGNSVLPFRLGEILRAYVLSRSETITTSSAFGTIILERLLDLLGLACIMIFFAFFSNLMEWSGSILIGLIIITVGGMIFVIWLGKSHSQFHQKLIHWKLFENRNGQKFLEIINNIFQGLTSIRETKHTFQLIFQTILIWFMYYVCIDLVVSATGIAIDWAGVGIIMITTTLAITVPSAPGFVGTYHAAAIYVLINLFGIELTEAQAFSVLIHAIGFIPLVIIGFIYFLKSSVHIRDVNEEKMSL